MNFSSFARKITCQECAHSDVMRQQKISTKYNVNQKKDGRSIVKMRKDVQDFLIYFSTYDRRNQ